MRSVSWKELHVVEGIYTASVNLIVSVGFLIYGVKLVIILKNEGEGKRATSFIVRRVSFFLLLEHRILSFILL